MSSSEPLVCAVMLTKDRPAMARRAVECFRQQTYQNKRLYIYDTGRTPCTDSLPDGFPDCSIVYHRGLDEGLTIGALRNRANWWGVRPTAASQDNVDADILIHFDDDDYSHPRRIEEQVALLQASGKDCVGYRDMLFWREHKQTLGAGVEYSQSAPPKSLGSLVFVTREAWLYSNADPRYCLGTSLCYWRKTWEARPFPNLSRGEDKAWLRGVESIGVESFMKNPPIDLLERLNAGEDFNPRMIASFHGGNTSTPDPSTSVDFKRAPEWDSHCRSVMQL